MLEPLRFALEFTLPFARRSVCCRHGETAPQRGAAPKPRQKAQLGLDQRGHQRAPGASVLRDIGIGCVHRGEVPAPAVGGCGEGRIGPSIRSKYSLARASGTSGGG